MTIVACEAVTEHGPVRRSARRRGELSAAGRTGHQARLPARGQRARRRGRRLHPSARTAAAGGDHGVPDAVAGALRRAEARRRRQRPRATPGRGRRRARCSTPAPPMPTPARWCSGAGRICTGPDARIAAAPAERRRRPRSLIGRAGACCAGGRPARRGRRRGGPARSRRRGNSPAHGPAPRWCGRQDAPTPSMRRTISPSVSPRGGRFPPARPTAPAPAACWCGRARQ